MPPPAPVSSLSAPVAAPPPQATNASRPAGTVGIDVSALYPKFVRLPAVSGQPPRALGDSALMAWHTTQDMSVVLHASPVGPLNPRGTEWWAVRQTSNDTSPFGARQGEGLRLIIIADRLAGGSAGSTLFAGGVVAFYSAVVLAIARLLRGSLGGTRCCGFVFFSMAPFLLHPPTATRGHGVTTPSPRSRRPAPLLKHPPPHDNAASCPALPPDLPPPGIAADTGW